jgi:PASTA domain-containing protein
MSASPRRCSRLLAATRQPSSTTAMGNETTSVNRHASERSRRLTASRYKGRQTVGDYVGYRAGEAAQAVRCAGLKPGLDRAFDTAPELFGQVIAQDPLAGSELARNSLVTLYVAAPDASEPDERRAEDNTPLGEKRSRIQPVSPGEPRGSLGERLRRKPGRANHARKPAEVSAPPLPRTELPQGHEAVSERAPRELDEPRPSPALTDGCELASPRSREQQHTDGFVIQAEEVFGREPRAGLRPWARVYPRRGAGDLRVRLIRHRGLVGTVLGVAVLWFGFGAVSTLSGHSERHASGGAPASTLARSTGRAVAARPGGRLARARARRFASARRPSPRRCRARGHGAHVGPAAGHASARAAVRARALAPAHPTTAQSEPRAVRGGSRGGPFSP